MRAIIMFLEEFLNRFFLLPKHLSDHPGSTAHQSPQSLRCWVVPEHHPREITGCHPHIRVRLHDRLIGDELHQITWRLLRAHCERFCASYQGVNTCTIRTQLSNACPTNQQQLRNLVAHLPCIDLLLQRASLNAASDEIWVKETRLYLPPCVVRKAKETRVPSTEVVLSLPCLLH